MRPRTAALWGAVALAVVAFFVSVAPPSDQRLLRIFAERRAALDQLAALYFAEPEPFVFSADGSTWPEEIALSEERRGQYRALLAELGVSRVLGDNRAGEISLYFDSPLPNGPLKSFVHSAAPPAERTTTGSTSSYVFLPGQYRRVCRPIEGAWHICLDKES